MPHEGGLKKCRQISDTVRDRIRKLAKPGAFEGDSDDTKPAATKAPTRKKVSFKGTANTVVEEEDDGEETEVEDDGFPPREHLFQMLGMQNVIVGQMNKSEEPTTTASGARVCFPFSGFLFCLSKK